MPTVCDSLPQQIMEIQVGTRTEAVCMGAGIRHKLHSQLQRLISVCGGVGSKVCKLDLQVNPFKLFH